jgi:hypothetical protein
MAGKGSELVIAMGKPKAGAPMADDEAAEGMPDDELSAFGEYADDVFDALKRGDRGAFKSALKSAVKACYASEE